MGDANTRQATPPHGLRRSLGARTLAAQAGVSRTTVERALGQLAAEGVIYSQPRRGYFRAPADGPVTSPATRERWAGYVWATAPDSTQRRRWADYIRPSGGLITDYVTLSGGLR